MFNCVRDAATISTNKTGILVDPNDLNEIATAIIDLLQNENKRTKYGENGKNRVLKGFTWEKVAQTYANLFNNILADLKT